MQSISISHVLKAVRPLSACASSLSRVHGGVVKSLSAGNPMGSSCSSADVALSGRPKFMLKYAETSWLNSHLLALKEKVSVPYALSFQNFIHTAGSNDFNSEGNSKPMDFVREVIEQGGSHLSHNNADQNADIVHIKLTHNNTFVTLTDYKGNKKKGHLIRQDPRTKELINEELSGSSGRVLNKMGGPKMSRYTAEATAEYFGRKARGEGLKSIVIKVKGFTYFKKKRQAITSYREGLTDSRSDWNPIVAIEDTTRRPHNGCRLPKRRRI
uniref:Putative ribosomal protein S11 n=1 Tax=Rhizophora mucronata TaxID=61149 RepID=A0A2P2P1I4_RHIMU